VAKKYLNSWALSTRVFSSLAQEKFCCFQNTSIVQGSFIKRIA